MNTRIVDPRTLWAVLAMEAGVVLPIISLPSQGDRVPGLAGPLLLMLLLPLGFLTVRLFPALRDPSWRLLIGIGAALLTRALVSSLPDAGPAALATWLTRSLVPAAIGIALWWRGGALTVAELTPGDIRTEFNVLAVAMLAALVVVRPFVLADQVLLGGAVSLFAVGGLLATVFARQDAADAVRGGSGRALGGTMALVPVGIAAVLVSVLQPDLLGAMWVTLGRIVELLLTPLGILLAWLASLLPRVPAGQLPPPPPLAPIPPFTPDPAQLDQMQEQMGWLGTLVLLLLVLAVGIAAVLVVRVMLAHWLGPPARPTETSGPLVEVDHSRTAGGDARALLGWLLRWLRGQARFGGRPGLGPQPSDGRRAGGRDGDVVDAWAAYQRLLEWASQRGLGRRPAETTGQLQARLSAHVPDTADAVDLVTSTYEQERYGAIHPPSDRLRRLKGALARLASPPRS